MSSTLQLNFLEIKMWKLILFVGVICTDIASCQKFRLFNTNYKLCSGPEQGLLKINGIGISAPLAQKDNCLNKHLLVKGGAGLKNSAHGSLPALPPQDFCDIARDSCKASNPPCDQMLPGQTVELCSVMRVPDDPLLLNPLIQPDVLVRWRIMYESQFDESVCEKNYNLQPGQIPLVCIDIDSKVVNTPKCPGGVLGK